MVTLEEFNERTILQGIPVTQYHLLARVRVKGHCAASRSMHSAVVSHACECSCRGSLLAPKSFSATQRGEAMEGQGERA